MGVSERCGAVRLHPLDILAARGQQPLSGPVYLGHRLDRFSINPFVHLGMAIGKGERRRTIVVCGRNVIPLVRRGRIGDEPRIIDAIGVLIQHGYQLRDAGLSGRRIS